MKPAPVELEATVEAELRASALAGLRNVAGGVAAIFAAFLLLETLVPQTGFSIPRAGWDLTLIAVFLAIRFSLKRGLWPERQVYALCSLLAMLVLARMLQGTSADAVPLATSYTVMVLVGVGYFQLSRRWLLFTLAAMIGTWGVCLLPEVPRTERFEWVLTVVFGGVVAFLIHRARRLSIASDGERARELQRELARRRESEQALRYTSASRAALFEATLSGLTVRRLSDRALVSVNGAMLQMLGYTRAEFEGLGPADYIHPDSLATFERMWDAVARGEKFEYRARAVRKDGSVIDVEGHFVPFVQDGAAHALGVTQDVTLERRAQQALAESEARYRRLVEDQSEFIVRWLPDGTRTFVNGAYCEYFGITREEALGTPFMPLVWHQDRDLIRSKIASLTPESPASTMEHRVTRPDGAIGWNEWTDRGLFDDEGRLVELQSVGRDVTDRKEAERKLRSSEERYRNLVEQVPVGLYHTNREGEFVTVNHALVEMLGYDSREELMAAGVSATRTSEEDGQGSSGSWVSGGVPCLPLRRKDGAVIWVEDHVRHLRNASGEPLAQWGILEDVTERRWVERIRSTRLRVSRVLGAAGALDQLLAGVRRVLSEALDTDGVSILLFDEGGEGEPGGSEEATDGARGERRLRFPLTLNERIIGLLSIERSPELARLGSQARDLLSAVGEDIAQAIGRVRSEEALRESEKRFRRFSDAVADGIFFHVNGRILDANLSMQRMSGYTLDELIGKSVLDLIAPEDRARIAAGLPGATSASYRITGLRKDGALMPFGVRGETFDSQGGVPVRVVTVQDLSRTQALEAQLAHAQKMESIGRLAGGVAHDFNNLLTAIKGYSELIIGRLPEADPIRQDAEEIRQAGDRAATLTRQLLAFSRQQVFRTRVLDLNDVVSGFEKLLGRTLGADVEQVIRLEPEPLRIKADPGQIEQILMNLAVNARDAMPQGGRLLIETERVVIGKEEIESQPDARPGRFMRLTVTDDGCGMDASTRDRLFEPFFTTKPEGMGTGLGLSTVYGIVQQSGGFITVYSEPGRGSSFKIYLPAAEDSGEEALPGVPIGAGSSKGSETVLLVDDDAAIRQLAARILSQEGYRVITAAGPEDATRIAATNGGIDLLLTDVVMPGMSGTDLAARILAIDPGMRVLLASGYPNRALEGRNRRMEYLAKPYTRESLCAGVRRALDSPLGSS